MTTKHTPGPWITDNSTKGRFMVIADNGTEDGVLVADGLNESNARLIASAPELLAALERLLLLWEDSIDNEPDYMGMANFARAAIAKARGE